MQVEKICKICGKSFISKREKNTICPNIDCKKENNRRLSSKNYWGEYKEKDEVQKRTSWTDADTETLENLALKCESYKEIAEKMKKNTSVIRKKCIEKNITLINRKSWSKWTLEEDKTLEKMFMKNCSNEEIMEVLNRSNHAIKQRITRLNLSEYKKRRSHERK